jgi:site-specific DNA recombinase
MPKITKIEPKIKALPQRKKVAAYARVSMETERLHHSLSAQVSYYSELIQKNPEWQYAGVYADEGITGTSTMKRPEFQRMLADCEAGKIDIILTKSISRFARNTVDLLETVRHLKELGIEVRFEKEHINSLSGDGEVMLTLLASFAQSETESISNNVKWGIRKRMQAGMPYANGHMNVYGYRWEGDEMVIVPEEAAIVRASTRTSLTGNPGRKPRRNSPPKESRHGRSSVGGFQYEGDPHERHLHGQHALPEGIHHRPDYEEGQEEPRRAAAILCGEYASGHHHKETFDYVQAEMARCRAERKRRSARGVPSAVLSITRI